MQVLCTVFALNIFAALFQLEETELLPFRSIQFCFQCTNREMCYPLLSRLPFDPVYFIFPRNEFPIAYPLYQAILLNQAAFFAPFTRFTELYRTYCAFSKSEGAYWRTGIPAEFTRRRRPSQSVDETKQYSNPPSSHTPPRSQETRFIRPKTRHQMRKPHGPQFQPPTNRVTYVPTYPHGRTFGSDCFLPSKGEPPRRRQWSKKCTKINKLCLFTTRSLRRRRRRRQRVRIIPSVCHLSVTAWASTVPCKSVVTEIHTASAICISSASFEIPSV